MNQRAAREADVACPGPFVWYPCEGGAVLLCATCGHLTVTGNPNAGDHADTPVLAEGVR